MTKYKVDLAELDAVIASLDAFAKTFATQLGELDTAISALQADWLGEAATAQAVAHRKIAAGASEMHSGLTGLHAVARHAHASYTAAIQANVATWKQLRS